MNESTYQLIKELTELQGISGHERRIREYMKDQMTELVDEIHQSRLGNIFGIKKSSQNHAPRLMIAAHMDEVGFIVREVTDRGLMRVTPIGGWNPYVISAQRFTLQTKAGDYPVVSGAVPPHLLRDGNQKDSLSADSVLFDAGFNSKEEAEEYGVRPGDPVVPAVETVRTANEDSIICKAWDNRYGCAVVIETLREIQGKDLPNELVIGATVQEEVGLRGVRGAVHQFQPDVFIAVDCSPANDTEKETTSEGQLGRGFLLRVQDPGMITHNGLREYIQDTASSYNIPYQYFFSKGGTDAGAAHTMNDGIPSAVIGVPARYIHGHQTLFKVEDYEAAKEFLQHLVINFDQTTYETIIQA
ncbi:glutamyl aminopeptidase [Facklamia sp. DSM 111018]|uniref:Glutamyl aminopeptidase n=1 Tax=Facklamia lactis TaxID=2749967 RepID=A0ABS0LS18_9LACT|nr:glutamyl aminopeptidase [Facklamia lactis]MBG9980875.1 glutamyl aminopeptidase [Facklamia lactis]MBG9986762.1 glutamyl aminopeptidase [Facklamia lactis]